MQKVLIIPNMTKDNAEACTALTIAKLSSVGIEALLDNQYQSTMGRSGARFGVFQDLLEECCMLLAIGGDGTMIHAAKHGLETGKPILGINAGRLGFLAQLEPTELDRLLLRLAQGDYRVESRTVLSASLDGAHQGYAINDAVLMKGPNVNIADYEVYCDQRFMDAIRADGIIFATPTGSTAYSLSAGGPIIDPTIDAMLMTPICPHMLSVRPTLFSGRSKLSASSSEVIQLAIDGEAPILVRPGSSVTITKATVEAKFITFEQKPFFEILSTKIKNRG